MSTKYWRGSQIIAVRPDGLLSVSNIELTHHQPAITIISLSTPVEERKLKDSSVAAVDLICSIYVNVSILPEALKEEVLKLAQECSSRLDEANDR